MIAGDSSSAWVPVAYVGESDGTPGSWFRGYLGSGLSDGASLALTPTWLIKHRRNFLNNEHCPKEPIGEPYPVTSTLILTQYGFRGE